MPAGTSVTTALLMDSMADEPPSPTRQRTFRTNPPRDSLSRDTGYLKRPWRSLTGSIRSSPSSVTLRVFWPGDPALFGCVSWGPGAAVAKVL